MKYIATVCIFLYNQQDYIEKTLKSVINQKTKYPYKIVVVDDYSTDQSREVIDKVVDDSQSNNIIRIYQDQNRGLNYNIEYIFKRLDTKYVFILGGDDYWIDEKKIEKQVDLLERDPNISYVHTGYDKLEEYTNTIKDGPHSWYWDMPQDRIDRVIYAFMEKWSSYPCSSTCCIRTEIIKEGLIKYGKLLHSYLSGEGTFIHVSVCMIGDKYAFIPEASTMYLVRQESLSHFKKPEDYFNFQVNYFKTKIEALYLINAKPKRCLYFYIYNLNNLLRLAHANELSTEFDNLLESVKTALPITIRYYFYLCNHFSFFYRVNRKMMSLKKK